MGFYQLLLPILVTWVRVLLLCSNSFPPHQVNIPLSLSTILKSNQLNRNWLMNMGADHGDCSHPHSKAAPKSHAVMDDDNDMTQARAPRKRRKTAKDSLYDDDNCETKSDPKERSNNAKKDDGEKRLKRFVRTASHALSRSTTNIPIAKKASGETTCRIRAAA